MNIMGLNDVAGAHHNSSIALVQDGQITFAASEERFTRKKHEMAFPANAIKAALDFTGLSIDDIDYFAVGYPPSSFYLDLFCRSFWDLPRSVLGLVGHNFWGMFKYLFPNIRKMYKPASFSNGLFRLGVDKEKIKFIDHHLSHAASAYRCSGFDRCLALSMDGFGPNAKGTNIAGQVYICEDGNMQLVDEFPLYVTALWYSGFTVALNLKYMDGEGKTMGLAAYGDPKVCYSKVRELVIDYKDGKWIGYPYWIDYVMVPRKSVFVKTHTGRKIMKMIEKYSKENVSAAAQLVLEEILVTLMEDVYKKHPFSKIALAGGTFLNVKVNKDLLALPYINEVFIHPHASDGGTAMGAALQLYHELTGEKTVIRMRDSDLGIEFNDPEIEAELRNYSDQVSWERLDGNLPEYVGEALTKGKVIGWFQGREEWGPRALGRRSVLADPRKAETRDLINHNMKNREWFMPFAPSCMQDKGDEFFENFCETSFMTMAFDVKKGKEDFIRSAIHVDDTARVHSVRPDNELYYRVIKKFHEETGVPVILNTSFNRHGLPIVNSPKDAIEHLLWGCVHELAIGNYLVRKKD